MTRRLLNVSAYASLLILMSVCVLWWRSYRHYDVWSFTDRHKWRYTVWSLDGMLEWTETPHDDASEAVKNWDMRFIEVRHRNVIGLLAIVSVPLLILRVRSAMAARKVVKRKLAGESE